MTHSKALKGILIVLGLVLIIIGLLRLFDPIAFFANSGLVLSNQAGQLSEARAAGGAVLGSGIVVLLGAFIQRLSYTSTIAAIVVFLGFGIARVIGLGLDGDPGMGVIQGMIIELVLGLLSVFALIKYREK
jgi:hypothetical protein